MSLSSQRRLAADILKVGKGRVWIDPDRIEEVEIAITREELRRLIHEGAIRSLPKMGVSRTRARVLHEKRKKGLGRGPGRKSGSSGSIISKKHVWMNRIRTLRGKLRELKQKRVITESTYRQLYSTAGSGAFKSVSELERYIKTRGLWRKR